MLNHCMLCQFRTGKTVSFRSHAAPFTVQLDITFTYHAYVMDGDRRPHRQSIIVLVRSSVTAAI
jgi:hypothetical protein